MFLILLLSYTFFPTAPVVALLSLTTLYGSLLYFSIDNDDIALRVAIAGFIFCMVLAVINCLAYFTYLPKG
jgi:hypothetical protein